MAYMDATFSINEISEEETENKEATVTTSKAPSTTVTTSEASPTAPVAAPMVGEEQQSESAVPVGSSLEKSSTASSTPTKRSRRTTSLDLLYQNIK